MSELTKQRQVAKNFFKLHINMRLGYLFQFEMKILPSNMKKKYMKQSPMVTENVTELESLSPTSSCLKWT